MYGQDILCGISKGTSEIPHMISIHWKMQFLYYITILRALSVLTPPPQWGWEKEQISQFLANFMSLNNEWQYFFVVDSILWVNCVNEIV